MGKLKEEASATPTEDVQTHKLTEAELNYLQLLNLVLQYHTWAQRIMSGYLYYVATTRLGYKDGVNLQFEWDPKTSDTVVIKLLPDNFDQAAPSADTTK